MIKLLIQYLQLTLCSPIWIEQELIAGCMQHLSVSIIAFLENAELLQDEQRLTGPLTGPGGQNFRPTLHFIHFAKLYYDNNIVSHASTCSIVASK